MRHDDNYLHEIIGTKYLRLAQWAKAEKHLAQVSLDFINTMNIVPFMARRNYQVEPWLNRQRIKEEHQLPGNAKTTSNQKLSFVREMQQLEQGFGTGEFRRICFHRASALQTPRPKHSKPTNWQCAIPRPRMPVMHGT